MPAAKPIDTEGPATFDEEKLYLVARIADDIAPHLADRPQDRGMACQMAWHMVQSYLPNSEAEVLGAARIVSLSLTQLDLLRASAATDLTPALKLRLVGAAIALNRSITQTECALARLQCSGDVRRPDQPVRAGKSNANAEVATGGDAAMADLAMRRARLLAEIARLEVRAAAAKRAADRASADDEGTPAAPLSRPVADPVDPVSAPAAPPAGNGFDAAADFRRRVAAAHCHDRAMPIAAPPRAPHTAKRAPPPG